MCNSNLAVFSMRYLKFEVVQLNKINDSVSTWKNLRFMSSEVSDFHAVGILLVGFHSFPIHMFKLLSVDKLLQLR